MRKHVAAASAVFLALGVALAQDAASKDARAWPRTFSEGDLSFTLFEPQLEKWERLSLKARAALSVTPRGATTSYGVVWFTARTEIEKEARVVLLDHFEITKASFPSAGEREDAWVATLRKSLPENARALDLDRLEFALAAQEVGAKGARVPLKNDPPRIFLASEPSLLVLVDGKPVLRRVPGTPLLRVINTRALILGDEDARRFYLAVADRWAEASSLEGPFELAGSVPDGAEAAKREALESKTADTWAGEKELVKLLEAGRFPKVFASTEPAELIVTAGEPETETIEGTNLVFVTNSDGDVFFDTGTSECYVLISGRWFRASSREGPWSYVPPEQLPADFARIPRSSAAAEVLACVPGTPQAREALAADALPETARVDRSKTTLEIPYDGDPVVTPLEGTDLRWIENTSIPVLVVDGVYFACDRGLWFRAPGPRGPWRLADSVPSSIYEIPPTSPLFQVTFVRVYESLGDSVSCGYTPGYLGACVARNSVVWGTGYRYRPWIKERWFGRPWTYGFGVGVRWNESWGWGVELGVGSDMCCKPWWRPFDGALPVLEPRVRDLHVNFNNADVYSGWEGVVRVVPVPNVVRAAAPRPQVAPFEDVYASPQGAIFRRSAAGDWEQHASGAWRSAVGHVENGFPADQFLETERQIRQQALQRMQLLGRETSIPHVAPGLRGSAIRHR
jgi:hypothetical protein